MDRIGGARKVLFGLAIAGVLGFGASQAVAAPGPAPRALSCLPECEAICGPSWGYPVRNGRCLCCAEP